MSQYKVPQNIDMQDRIVGPLTIRQFLYLLIGGMISYGTLKTPGSIDFILIGLPVGITALAFAFLKINDQPFSRFVWSLVAFSVNPKKRVWHHGSGSPQINLTQAINVNKKIEVKKISRDTIAQIANQIDYGK